MMMKKTLAAICFSLLTATTAAQATPATDTAHNAYQLKEMVVLSRHNIRSPLSGNGSALAKITPHKWFSWTSAPSELSQRGGELETMMGQYFRKRLEKEQLIPENYQPKEGEVRFYANSMQRTIATAQYFSSGMLPVANVRIEHKYAPSKMDPVFNPQLTFVSDAFRTQAMKEIRAMGGSKGLQGINENLSDEYRLMEQVLDLSKSEAAKTTGLKQFRKDDLEIVLDLNKEPSMRGSLKTANQASDAIILQYYEESDPLKAGFNHKLTNEDWVKLARIKDVYGDVLFTAPSVAVNVAHPLLQEIRSELSKTDRKFTFLCGHDSNIASVLTALDTVPYSLPQSIEKKTPIGSKVVIEKWLGKDGQEYASLSLVYQSTTQLRDRTMLSLDTPPMSYPLSLNGLTRNKDGLYRLSDVEQRFDQAIAAYDKLPQDTQAYRKAA